MKKKIIIIILAVALVGAGLYFFVFSAAPKEPEVCYYTPGDYFVTNVKDSTALFKVTIVLEYLTTDDTVTTEYFTKVNHVIRDIIVFTLRSKTEAELRSQGITPSILMIL